MGEYGWWITCDSNGGHACGMRMTSNVGQSSSQHDHQLVRHQQHGMCEDGWWIPFGHNGGHGVSLYDNGLHYSGMNK
jgi:hypothetical protein